jgi:hypothetical protein
LNVELETGIKFKDLSSLLTGELSTFKTFFAMNGLRRKKNLYVLGPSWQVFYKKGCMNV